MKGWVVAQHFDYEGYDTPIGVFSSFEKALDAGNALIASGHLEYSDDLHIFEYEIDVPNNDPLDVSRIPSRRICP